MEFGVSGPQNIEFGLYCANLKQQKSRKLFKVLFKYIFPINGPKMAIIIAIIVPTIFPMIFPSQMQP